MRTEDKNNNFSSPQRQPAALISRYHMVPHSALCVCVCVCSVVLDSPFHFPVAHSGSILFISVRYAAKSGDTGCSGGRSRQK